MTFTERMTGHLAWPLVLLILVWVLWDKVKALANKLVEVVEAIGERGGTAKAKVGNAEVALSPSENNDLRETAGDLARPTAPAVMADTVSVADTVRVEHETGPSWQHVGQYPEIARELQGQDPAQLNVPDLIEAGERRRAQLQILIDLAAKWGWSQGRTIDTFHHPVIEWDAAGKPKIIYGTQDTQHIEEAYRQASQPHVGSATATITLTGRAGGHAPDDSSAS